MSADRVQLVLNENNSVTVHLYGATVISWIHNGKEVLFVSSKSLFDNKKAIRGGIPVVFPNFGPWDLGPQHGFARISRWKLVEEPKVEQGSVTVTFSLTNSEQTEAMWKYKFRLLYKVVLSADSLTTSLTVENTDSQQFDFTTLLHTYIRLDDVNQTTVSNLKGLAYKDKLKGGEQFNESSDLVKVVGGADSVYMNTPTEHMVVDQTSGLKVRVRKSNLPDTVLWNPWVENAAKMSDFGDEEYKNMICVEPGFVSERVQLTPGGSATFAQEITVVKA